MPHIYHVKLTPSEPKVYPPSPKRDSPLPATPSTRVADVYRDNPQHQPNWFPGEWGKGIIFRNGEVHTWNTHAPAYYVVRDGLPFHQDYLRNLGDQKPNAKVEQCFHITPNGESTHSSVYDEFVNEAQPELFRNENGDWTFSKVASVPIQNGDHHVTNYLGGQSDERTTPWEPGLSGKLVLLPEGLHMWATGNPTKTWPYSNDREYFDPHHDGIYDHIRGSQQESGKTFHDHYADYADAPKMYIDTDGTIDPGIGQGSMEHAIQIANMHPELKPPRAAQKTMDWTFNSKVSGTVLDNTWERGKWGKGILLNGDGYFWTVDGTGTPHHYSWAKAKFGDWPDGALTLLIKPNGVVDMYAYPTDTSNDKAKQQLELFGNNWPRYMKPGNIGSIYDDNKLNAFDLPAPGDWLFAEAKVGRIAYDPRMDEADWRFTKAAVAFKHHEVKGERLEAGGPDAGGWGGRIPMIYEHATDTIHTGPPDTTHYQIQNDASLRGKRIVKPVSRGWIGYNPEKRTRGAENSHTNYGWYDELTSVPIPDHVDTAVREHFGIKDERLNEDFTDMSGWVFGSMSNVDYTPYRDHKGVAYGEGYIDLWPVDKYGAPHHDDKTEWDGDPKKFFVVRNNVATNAYDADSIHENHTGLEPWEDELAQYGITIDDTANTEWRFGGTEDDWWAKNDPDSKFRPQPTPVEAKPMATLSEHEYETPQHEIVNRRPVLYNMGTNHVYVGPHGTHHDGLYDELGDDWDPAEIVSGIMFNDRGKNALRFWQDEMVPYPQSAEDALVKQYGVEPQRSDSESVWEFESKTGAVSYNVIDSDVTPEQSFLADDQDSYTHSPFILQGNNIYIGPQGTHHADLIWRHVDGEADPSDAIYVADGWGHINNGAVHMGDANHPHDKHAVGEAVAKHTGLPYEREDESWAFSKTTFSNTEQRCVMLKDGTIVEEDEPVSSHVMLMHQQGIHPADVKDTGYVRNGGYEWLGAWGEDPFGWSFEGAYTTPRVIPRPHEGPSPHSTPKPAERPTEPRQVDNARKLANPVLELKQFAKSFANLTQVDIQGQSQRVHAAQAGEKWEPGHWGKALVLQDGTVKAWATNDTLSGGLVDGGPWHEHMTDEEWGTYHSLVINPKGEVSSINADYDHVPNTPFSTDDAVEMVVKAIGGTPAKQNGYFDSRDWHFGKMRYTCPEGHSYSGDSCHVCGHTTMWEKVAAEHKITWTPGSEGKLMVSDKGVVHAWNTDRNGRPHHFQYAQEELGEDCRAGYAPEGWAQGWIDEDGVDIEGSNEQRDIAAKMLDMPLKGDGWSFGKVAYIVPEGYDEPEDDSFKGLRMKDGREYRWHQYGWKSNTNHADVMIQEGIHPEDVAEYLDSDYSDDGWNFTIREPAMQQDFINETRKWTAAVTQPWKPGSGFESAWKLDPNNPWGELVLDITPWKPGEYGKLLVTPDGQVHHWTCDENGCPHHGEYAKTNGLMDNPIDWVNTSQGYLDPDCTLEMSKFVSTPEHEAIARKALPMTHEPDDDWVLSKTAQQRPYNTPVIVVDGQEYWGDGSDDFQYHADVASIYGLTPDQIARAEFGRVTLNDKIEWYENIPGRVQDEDDIWQAFGPEDWNFTAKLGIQHWTPERDRYRASSAFKLWTPGSYGKFLVTPEGQVHSWTTTSGDGAPTHSTYVAEHPDLDGKTFSDDLWSAKPQYTPGWIDKDGSIDGLNDAANRAEHMQLVTERVPGTKQGGDGSWVFGNNRVGSNLGIYRQTLPSNPALSGARIRLDPWTKGQVGKFLVTPEGEVHHWTVDETDYPHHNEAMHMLGLPMVQDYTYGYVDADGKYEATGPQGEVAATQLGLRPKGEDAWYFGHRQGADNRPSLKGFLTSGISAYPSPKLENEISDKFASRVASSDWVEGERGKGLITDDGSLHTWNGYSPHHDRIAEHDISYDNLQKQHYFGIGEDGSVFPYYSQDTAELASKLDPRLKINPKVPVGVSTQDDWESNWTFSSLRIEFENSRRIASEVANGGFRYRSEYADKEMQIAEPWHPGILGKYIVRGDEITLWGLTHNLEPHHEQVDPDMDWDGHGYIEVNGGIEPYDGEAEWVVGAHPALHVPEAPTGWNFSKIANDDWDWVKNNDGSYQAPPYVVPEGEEPPRLGAYGKAFQQRSLVGTDTDDTVYAWATDGTGSPHHGEIALRDFNLKFSDIVAWSIDPEGNWNLAEEVPREWRFANVPVIHHTWTPGNYGRAISREDGSVYTWDCGPDPDDLWEIEEKFHGAMSRKLGLGDYKMGDTHHYIEPDGEVRGGYGGKDQIVQAVVGEIANSNSENDGDDWVFARRLAKYEPEEKPEGDWTFSKTADWTFDDKPEQGWKFLYANDQVYMLPHPTFHNDIIDKYDLDWQGIKAYGVINPDHGVEFWEGHYNADEATKEVVVDKIAEKLPNAHRVEGYEHGYSIARTARLVGDPENMDPAEYNLHPVVYDADLDLTMIGHEGLHHHDIHPNADAHYTGVACVGKNGDWTPGTIEWFGKGTPSNHPAIDAEVSKQLGTPLKTEVDPQWKFGAKAITPELCRPWVRGEWGRYLVDSDGTVYSWHADDAEHELIINLGDIDEVDGGYITPDGKKEPYVGPIQNWVFGKAAKGNTPWNPGDPIEPWKPGVRGKGMYLDGEPVMWALSDQWDGPHHEDVAFELDPSESKPVTGYFHINGDGSVEAEGAYDPKAFIAHDPRLKMVDRDAPWTYSRAKDDKLNIIHVNDVNEVPPYHRYIETADGYLAAEGHHEWIMRDAGLKPEQITGMGYVDYSGKINRLDDAETNMRMDWTFSKVAGNGGKEYMQWTWNGPEQRLTTQPWDLGSHGKAVVYEDGSTDIWATDSADGSPIHSDIESAPVRSYLVISPEGEVSNLTGNSRYQGDSNHKDVTNDAQLIANEIGGRAVDTHDYFDDWRFSHAQPPPVADFTDLQMQIGRGKYGVDPEKVWESVREGWEPGHEGKGILTDGNLYTWKTWDDEGDPHHHQVQAVLEYAGVPFRRPFYIDAIFPDGQFDANESANELIVAQDPRLRPYTDEDVYAPWAFQ